MRILLAVDQIEIRSALKVLLEEVPEFVVVGEAANSGNLLELSKKIQPDLVILDYRLPIKELASLLSTLRERNTSIKTVVLSVRSEVREAVLESGADAFVSESDSPKRLLAALSKINSEKEPR
jgi:DNA-binding NarL/FixJ family response regulator